MKAVMAALASASLLLAFAGSNADASERRAYRGQYTPPSVITPEQRRHNEEAYERGDYYEHDSNALPFGSKAWFEQKRREAGG
jgi:hypothetical protein